MVAAPVSAQVLHNPGYDRPGLGFTPAVLQAGDVTLEQGLPDWTRSGGASTFTADTLLRLGVGHALELQLGSGWNRLTGPGVSVHGRSDTSLAVKFAPATAGDLAFGLLASVERADGAAAFRAGSTHYLLGASVNWQRSAAHASGFYLELGGGDARSVLLAVNDSWTLADRVGVYAELAARRVDGEGSGTEGGFGLAWQATPRIQLDIGMRHRLGGHIDTWQGGAGIAMYFGN